MVKVVNYMYNLPQFKSEKYLEAKDKTCEIVWAKLISYLLRDIVCRNCTETNKTVYCLLFISL